MVLILLGIPFCLLIWALVLPGQGPAPTPTKVLTRLAIVTFGILLPPFIFLASFILLPDWKGDCRFGALDCFILGKTALTPVVFFATAALYKVEILGTAKPEHRWVVLGLFLGSVVSGICFLFGLATYLAGRLVAT